MSIFDSLFTSKKALVKPYITQTPVREYIFDKISKIYSGSNATIEDVIYAFFTYNLLPIFNSRKTFHPNPVIGMKLKQDIVFLYYLPYYCLILHFDSLHKGYFSEQYIMLLRHNCELFLKDYCVVTGTDYKSTLDFYHGRMKHYIENSGIKNLALTTDTINAALFGMATFIMDINENHLHKKIINGKDVTNFFAETYSIEIENSLMMACDMMSNAKKRFLVGR